MIKKTKILTAYRPEHTNDTMHIYILHDGVSLGQIPQRFLELFPFERIGIIGQADGRTSCAGSTEETILQCVHRLRRQTSTFCVAKWWQTTTEVLPQIQQHRQFGTSLTGESSSIGDGRIFQGAHGLTHGWVAQEWSLMSLPPSAHPPPPPPLCLDRQGVVLHLVPSFAISVLPINSRR